MLAGYDIQLKNYVVNGLTNGFSIGCVGSRSKLDLSIRNLRSAYELPHIIDKKKKLLKELELDRIMGPYETVPAGDKYRISPLGVIPKKTIGEFRMIQHLSFPYGASINDSIPQEFSSVQYANIQDAIKFITKNKNTVYMAKVDIESAFRIIPVSPADRPFLGFKWRDKFYMDAVLPMGCSSSCAIFEAFSSSLHWIAENKLGISAMVHYLDDFLILAESKSKCTDDLQAFTEMCADIGVPLAPDKTVGATTELSFLGIELDTVQLEARLPGEKIEKCTKLLAEFAIRTKVTLKELQTLIGMLSSACSVIVPGRAFLRRLIDLTVGVTMPHHRIRVSKQVKIGH